MHLIGLTGGIASGKSTVARRLAEHGARILDADQLARDVVEPGSPALTRIGQVFGPKILNADGTLNRTELGQLVFSNPELRTQLEAIVHPAIQAEFERRISAITEAEPNAVIVYDVPLLVETKRDFPWELVITTRSGSELQLHRMVADRGYDPENAAARLSSQATDEQRIERADYVIDTSGSLAETVSQVDALWVDVLSKLD